MLKTRNFMNASELAAFVNDPTNNVTTVVAITYDTSSGKYVVFFN